MVEVFDDDSKLCGKVVPVIVEDVVPVLREGVAVVNEFGNLVKGGVGLSGEVGLFKCICIAVGVESVKEFESFASISDLGLM